MQEMTDWLRGLPKAELHLHIDGSLRAERMLDLAAKNKVSLPYASVAEVESAYNFSDLQSFLDLYYLGASVLQHESDFYHLMMDYLTTCREQNILHCEIMVEPQTYAPNGVSFATMMHGFEQAIKEARETWGQSVGLVLSFLRHLSEEDCLQTLQKAEPFRSKFVAIGLASAEHGNPPTNFERLYAAAREQGYLCVAHAGEEGPAEYVWDSLKRLHVQRIDHGVRAVEDSELIKYLAEQQIPLTVCPLSNVRLCVYEKMSDHVILKLLEQGVCVTVNSDDPAYFGGYLNENFEALARDLSMSKQQASLMARNSFKSSFIDEASRNEFLAKLDAYLMNEAP